MIKVATDAGGTFTDLVAFEESSGKIYLGKVLTTPKDPSQGVIEFDRPKSRNRACNGRGLLLRSWRHHRHQCDH